MKIWRIDYRQSFKGEGAFDYQDTIVGPNDMFLALNVHREKSYKQTMNGNDCTKVEYTSCTEVCELKRDK